MTHSVLSEIHIHLYKTLKTLQYGHHHHTSCTGLVSMVFMWNFLGKFVQMEGHLTPGFSKRYFCTIFTLGPNDPKNHHFHSLFSHFVITSHVVYMLSPYLEVKGRVQLLEKKLTPIYIKLRCHSQMMSSYHFT